MGLKAVHEKGDEIPEEFRDLYTEKGDKLVLTGISGVYTQTDVDRLKEEAGKHRVEKKEAQDKLNAWTALGELDDVQSKLDKFPELEAASKGKLDEDEIEKVVEGRVGATIKSRLAPVERENKQLREKLEASMASVEELTAKDRKRRVYDELDKAMATAKISPEFRDDVRLWGQHVFEILEDGSIQTRDNVGVTPALSAEGWLEEMVEKRPGWVQGSQGGGARGSGSSGGGFANNPWSAEHWSMTRQGQVVKEKGLDHANKLAKAAGTKVGGAKPAEKK